MLIIFGMKVVFRTVGEGTFFCPNEHGDRAYRRRSARRWFSVFWIPIIPLKHLGEVIECDSCKTRYSLEVLTVPTSADLSSRLTDGLRTAVVAVLTARGALDPTVRGAAVALLARKMPGAADSWIDADLRSIAPDSYEAHLAALGPQLSVAGREGFLGDLAWLAAAGGPYDEPTRAVLERIGGTLGLTPAHVRGVLAGAEDRRDAR